MLLMYAAVSSINGLDNGNEGIEGNWDFKTLDPAGIVLSSACILVSASQRSVLISDEE